MCTILSMGSHSEMVPNSRSACSEIYRELKMFLALTNGFEEAVCFTGIQLKLCVSMHVGALMNH